MGELLLDTGEQLLSTAIRRMLVGAGLTLAGAGVSVAVIEDLINRLKVELGQIPDLGLALIDLSGTDTAISFILSATLSRVAIQNAQLYLTRA